MFSKTKNENNEKKILKKKIIDLIMRKIQFINDFNENKKKFVLIRDFIFV